MTSSSTNVTALLKRHEGIWAGPHHVYFCTTCSKSWFF